MKQTDIKQACAWANGTTLEEMTGRSRVRNVADARKMAMALLREQGYAFARIGRMFDHHYATVIHACHSHDALNGTDAHYTATFRRVVETIRNKRTEACQLYTEKIILEPCRA